MANRSGTCWGFTRVPIVQPRAALSNRRHSARGQQNSQCTCRCHRRRRDDGRQRGTTTRPAISACTAPAAIFSTATAHTGMGAMTRFFDLTGVAELLQQRRATACTPWKIIEVPTTPAMSR